MCACNGGDPCSCPIPYYLTFTTMCQPVLYSVNGTAGDAPIRICEVHCSQAFIGGSEFVDYYVPCGLLGDRESCCMKV